MIKKLLLLLTITAVSLFAINFQTASKEELMSIKGIGEKRAAAIMKYRKTHKIRSAADLKAIPGIGDEIANNAAKGIKNADRKVSKAKRGLKKTKTLTKSTDKKRKQIKKSLKSSREKKEKSLKKVKKVAGDKTKRAEKRAKKKADKKAKKKLKK